MFLSGVPELDCLVPGAGGRQTHLGTMLHTPDCIIMTTEAGGLLCGEVSVEESSVQSSAEGMPRISKAAVQHCILHTQHISTVSSSLYVHVCVCVCVCVCRTIEHTYIDIIDAYASIISMVSLYTISYRGGENI